MADSLALTLAEFKARVNPSMDASRDTELQAVINAASEWVKFAAEWDFENDGSAVTVNLSGYEAIGADRDVLLLPQKYRPVIHSGGDLVTITEDGTALSVAEGYDTSADVILRGANDNARLELNRQGAPWSKGPANVAVTFKYGYLTAAIPAPLQQLVAEVAVLMFRSPNALGKSSRGHRTGSVAFSMELTPHSAEYLERITEGVF